MTDIASLGLEIHSDGVVVAKGRLGDLERQSGRTERAADTLKRAWQLSLAAVVAGFAAFGVGIAGAVKRMEEMNRLSRQTDQALRNSGNTARTSAREIEAWADALENRTGRAAEDVMAVSANLASFSFSRSAFFRSLELANDMAAAWGGDLRQNLEGLARALADPEKGLAMLTKRGITFTDEQKKMIANFIQLNDLAGAQGVVFDALEEQVKGVAEAGYGGLAKAWNQAKKAWEDAFEEMVRGEGQAKSLTGSLSDLAGTLSSPEFINAVVGFGTMIVNIINGIAQVAVGAAKAFGDFMKMVNAPGGAFSNFQAQTAPLNQRSLEVMQKQLLDKEAALARSLEGGGGWFGSNIGAQSDQASMRAEISALKQAIAARSNPSSFDVNGVFAGLNSQSYGSTEDMWKGLAPGTMFGQTAFNPYEGMILGGADKDTAAEKARKAYADLTRGAHEFIASQQLEAQALGMTAEAANRLRYEQDLLNKAANDNIKLTPAQRNELSALATEMAAVEERTRSLTEWYDIGRTAFGGFMSDFKRDLMSGTSLWESFGNAAGKALDSIADRALSMAANGIFDMIFGSLFGGFGGGSSLGGGWGIAGGFGGRGIFGIPGMADGGTVGRAGLSWVGEQGPELLRLPQGAQVIPNGPSMAMAANQNAASSNGQVTVRLLMPDGWRAEILEEAGSNAVRIVQANDQAQKNYRQNGGM